MGIREFSASLIGLPLFQARKKVEASDFALATITFEESSAGRLTVIGVDAEEEDGRIALTVSGINPIKFLPSMYQNNDVLRRFLWIVQHIHYDVVSLLDNLHFFFTPMEAPDDFLNWMGSWFNVSERLNLDPGKMRLFLQHALVLYRWRGTRVGMEFMVKIVTGLEPEIYENSFPLTEYVMFEDLIANGVITDAFELGQTFFTVHIPVKIDQLGKQEKIVIYELIKQEKPVNAAFYITYERGRDQRIRGTRIGQGTVVSEHGVQT